jgi:hypothetical protein
MELKCPNCGALIPAENINIQELLAVCSQCNHIFEFNRSVVARKRKPTDLNPPKRLRIYEEDDRLELSYRAVLGPGPKFGLIMSALGSIFFSIMLVGAAPDGAPPPVLLFISLLAVTMWYLVAVLLTTTTQIIADEDRLEIQSGPLPFPISDDKNLRMRDVKRIFFEQGVEAWPPGVPSHHVYAELQDGSRVTLVTSLPYVYAYYIARALEGFLHPVVDNDTAVGEESEMAESSDELNALDMPAFRQDRSG